MVVADFGYCRSFHGGLFKNSKFLKLKKKLLCAFLCLSLGLKKPGDFTVSEGHGYPLVVINQNSILLLFVDNLS